MFFEISEWFFLSNSYSTWALKVFVENKSDEILTHHHNDQLKHTHGWCSRVNEISSNSQELKSSSTDSIKIKSKTAHQDAESSRTKCRVNKIIITSYIRSSTGSLVDTFFLISLSPSVWMCVFMSDKYFIKFFACFEDNSIFCNSDFFLGVDHKRKDAGLCYFNWTLHTNGVRSTDTHNPFDKLSWTHQNTQCI